MSFDLDRLLKALEKLGQIELEDVTIEADRLELSLLPSVTRRAVAREAALKEVKALAEGRFEFKPEEFSGQIEEVTIGATSGDGGTRESVVKLGGETAPAFYPIEGGMPNPPVVTFDVFDMSQPQFALEQRKVYSSVWDDPCTWAKFCEKELGAQMITIHLVSTDPLLQKIEGGKELYKTPDEGAKVVEEVLKATSLPIAVGGSGNPDNDQLVLEKAYEAAAGELVMLASATLSHDWKKVSQAAIDYGHNVLSWTDLDVNMQKQLNEKILDLGVPKDQIIIDPTSGALGYGIDYSFTVTERIRLGGLKGDASLQMPISLGVTNAWGAREAWKKRKEWGDRKYRGPIWEAVQALTLTLAGADLCMMLHPTAVQLYKDMLSAITMTEPEKKVDPRSWIVGI
ncbi:MAG: CO dehydrogenase/acetyl-CoA synthase subunit delta [Thermodesulfobacteriota bacterium]